MWGITIKNEPTCRNIEYFYVLTIKFHIFLTIFTPRNPFVRNFTKHGDSENFAEFPLNL